MKELWVVVVGGRGPSPVMSVVKNPPANAGDTGSIPGWIEKIPWRRAWEHTPVFLPGESHGQRSLADCSPWGCRVRRDERIKNLRAVSTAPGLQAGRPTAHMPMCPNRGSKVSPTLSQGLRWSGGPLQASVSARQDGSHWAQWRRLHKEGSFLAGS